jgi:hypothetical protein
MPRTNPSAESLSCSFCNKSQEAVGKLITSPNHYPRAYICNECIAVCASILEDDQAQIDAAAPGAPEEPHPLLSHPLVSQLLTAVMDWITQESLGNDVSEEVDRMRSIADRMIADGS